MNNSQVPGRAGLKKFHSSVLLPESLELLRILPTGHYVDCTLGEAGHSLEIYKQLDNGGKLYSFDMDQEAIDFVKKDLAEIFDGENLSMDKKWEIRQGNFARNLRAFSKENIKVDGILMDLGISSRQLEAVERGISYQEADQELDMRMDETLGVKASDLLKVLDERQLAQIFSRYGEERFAMPIAKAIKRSKVSIETVGQLVDVVSGAMPAAVRHSTGKNPARRVFQALRIAVNDELGSLSEALQYGYEILNKGGRFIVITFHSLEDRIVKEFFKKLVLEGKAIDITDKPIEASQEELDANSRAHSAKLRAIEII